MNKYIILIISLLPLQSYGKEYTQVNIHNWQGLYVGFSHGFTVNGSQTVTSNSYYSSIYNQETSGMVNSLQMQYLWQAHKSVFGMVGDITHNAVKLKNGNNSNIFNGQINFSGKYGYLLSGNLLAYGLAGIVFTKTNDFDYYGNSENQSKTTFGFSVGAGLEYKINSKFSIFTQYNYNNYLNVKFQGHNCIYCVVPNMTAIYPYYSNDRIIGNNYSSLKVGINYKF